MQNLFVPSEHPCSKKIHPIISSRLTLRSSKNTHPSKNPRLPRKNVTHFTLYQPPDSNKEAQSLTSSLSKSKSLLHLTVYSDFREIDQVKRTYLTFKNSELIKTFKHYFYVSNPKNMKKVLNIFAHSFQKTHYLNSLVLDFNMRSTSIIRKLTSIFQTMQNLTKLSFPHFTQDHETGNLLSPLLTGIQKLRSLSHLCLKFSQAFMDENQIEVLCSNLSKCRSLTHLELDVHRCPTLTNEGIKKLFLFGRSLKLAHFGLHLDLPSSPINEFIVYKDLVRIMEKTQDFELQDYSIYQGFHRGSIFKFSIKDLKTSKLHEFQVRFDQAQRGLIMALPNLQYLKSFYLCCSDYDGNDNLASNIAVCLLQMGSLERLSLEFGMGRHLSSLSGIIQHLNVLKMPLSLRVLKLKFRDFTLSDAQMKILLGSFLSKIRTLKVLSLDFGNCRISKKVFESLELLNLSGALRKLESLSLVLDRFIEKEKSKKSRGKKKVGVENFFASLKSLRDLKSLFLQFKNIYFSSEGKKALSKYIMEMKSLKTVEIESTFQENLEGAMRGFEDLFIESRALNSWVTFSVEFRRFMEVIPVVLNFEDSGGVPYSLEIDFYFLDGDYDDDDDYSRDRNTNTRKFIQKLEDFFKEMSPNFNFVGNNLESYRTLTQIARHCNPIDSLKITGPADKPLKVLRALAQILPIDGLKEDSYCNEYMVRKYSVKIISS